MRYSNRLHSADGGQLADAHGVVKVDGMGSFGEVFERTSSVLESLFRAG